MLDISFSAARIRITFQLEVYLNMNWIFQYYYGETLFHEY